MAVTTSYSGSRRANKRAAAAFAAKQKKQKVLIAVGLGLFALVLAYEVPHTLKLMSGGSKPAATAPVASSTEPTPVSPSATTSSQHSSAAWRALRHLPANNPFASSVSGQSGTYGNVAVPAKLNDPFANSVTGSGFSSTDASASSTVAIPKTIVIGSPGAGRKAKTGWIVILASIPSAQGRSAASAFAKKAAGRGVGSISILNSSTAKPLRGGYWVVYTGPFPTLNAVSQTASHVHSVGYGTAYVRQLVVYGKS